MRRDSDAPRADHGCDDCLDRRAGAPERSQSSGGASLLIAGPPTLDEDLRLAVQTRLPVLITASSGADREACARLIHRNGDSADGPFVAFARSAGAATPRLPASAAAWLRDGRGVREQFDRARGGTLFIDDITTLSLLVQAQICRVMGKREAAGGVHVIAGTNHDLASERAAGLVCERLFYRLNLIHIVFGR